jgi:hypothetical protein
MRGSLAASILLALLVGCAARAPAPSRAVTRIGGPMCLAALDRAGVSYSVAPAEAGVDACSVETPVRVTATGIAWNQPGVVSCGFALELDAFARDEVAPAARARFGKDVRAIRHFGAYSCRRENGGDGRWSQHAKGLAIDIAGFDLSDGTTILVARDWGGGDAKGAFLHEVARRACRRFGVVLTPDSDKYHRNHIHIDDGPWKLCER